MRKIVTEHSIANDFIRMVMKLQSSSEYFKTLNGNILLCKCLTRILKINASVITTVDKSIYGDRLDAYFNISTLENNVSADDKKLFRECTKSMYHYALTNLDPKVFMYLYKIAHELTCTNPAFKFEYKPVVLDRDVIDFVTDRKKTFDTSDTSANRLHVILCMELEKHTKRFMPLQPPVHNSINTDNVIIRDENIRLRKERDDLLAQLNTHLTPMYIKTLIERANENADEINRLKDTIIKLQTQLITTKSINITMPDIVASDSNKQKLMTELDKLENRLRLLA